MLSRFFFLISFSALRALAYASFDHQASNASANFKENGFEDLSAPSQLPMPNPEPRAEPKLEPRPEPEPGAGIDYIRTTSFHQSSPFTLLDSLLAFSRRL